MTTANQEGPAARPHATAKHTPAPWTDGGAGNVYAAVDGKEVMIALFRDTPPITSSQRIANAKLGAAAPALADMLRKAAATFRDMEQMSRALGRLPVAEACRIAAEHSEATLREAGAFP